MNNYYVRNTFSLLGFHKFCQMSIYRNIPFKGRIGKAFTNCIIWMFGMNLLLVVIANPGITNPGPPPLSVNGGNGSKLSIYFQNVQGLIPFGELDSAHPMLDTSKCLEISTYVREAQIDIIVLNETWLKNSVADSEFLHPDRYKVFRADRSVRTHPPDPTNPTRFRRNGGGVMIAVRTDLQVSTKEIRLKGVQRFSLLNLQPLQELSLLCVLVIGLAPWAWQIMKI